MGEGGRWEAGGRLYLPIGCLEQLRVQEVLVIGLDNTGGLKRHLTSTGVNIRSIPPMGPIVSIVTLHGWQNQL